jgi:hypothetical protein
LQKVICIENINYSLGVSLSGIAMCFLAHGFDSQYQKKNLITRNHINVFKIFHPTKISFNPLVKKIGSVRCKHSFLISFIYMAFPKTTSPPQQNCLQVNFNVFLPRIDYSECNLFYLLNHDLTLLQHCSSIAVMWYMWVQLTFTVLHIFLGASIVSPLSSTDICPLKKQGSIPNDDRFISNPVSGPLLEWKKDDDSWVHEIQQERNSQTLLMYVAKSNNWFSFVILLDLSASDIIWLFLLTWLLGHCRRGFLSTSPQCLSV